MSSEKMRQVGVEVFDRWTALWNLNLELAEQILAPELTLRYAQAGGELFDGISRPAQLADVIAGWHETHPGLQFAAEGRAVVDLVEGDNGPTGLIARPYSASFVDEKGERVERSGTDILKLTDGLIDEVWSVSSGAGGRTFYRR